MAQLWILGLIPDKTAKNVQLGSNLGPTLDNDNVGHQRWAEVGPTLLLPSAKRWHFAPSDTNALPTLVRRVGRTHVGQTLARRGTNFYECFGWLTDLWRFYLHNYKIFMVYLVLQRSTRRYCWRLRFIMLFIVHKPTPGKIKMFEYGVHGPTRGIFQLKSYLVQPVLNILLPVIIIL